MALPLTAQAARCDLMQDMCLAFCPVRIHDRAPTGCRLNARWMDAGEGPACVLQGLDRLASARQQMRAWMGRSYPIMGECTGP